MNPRSVADLWSVSNNVQRTAWLARALQPGFPVSEHTAKDWTQLPDRVIAALMGVR